VVSISRDATVLFKVITAIINDDDCFYYFQK